MLCVIFCAQRAKLFFVQTAVFDVLSDAHLLVGQSSKKNYRDCLLKAQKRVKQSTGICRAGRSINLNIPFMRQL